MPQLVSHVIAKWQPQSLVDLAGQLLADFLLAVLGKLVRVDGDEVAAPNQLQSSQQCNESRADNGAVDGMVDVQESVNGLDAHEGRAIGQGYPATSMAIIMEEVLAIDLLVLKTDSTLPEGLDLRDNGQEVLGGQGGGLEVN